MEFDTLFISKPEYRRLRKLSKHPKGLRSQPPETTLAEYRLITKDIWYDDDGNSIGLHSKITDKGKRYLQFVNQQRRQNRKDSFRFILSTLVAVLALIIAVIALMIDLWQLGLL